MGGEFLKEKCASQSTSKLSYPVGQAWFERLTFSYLDFRITRRRPKWLPSFNSIFSSLSFIPAYAIFPVSSDRGPNIKVRVYFSPQTLWSQRLSPNYHLIVCLAILDKHRHIIMENRFGFTEILKVHELLRQRNCQLDLKLSCAKLPSTAKGKDTNLSYYMGIYCRSYTDKAIGECETTR